MAFNNGYKATLCWDCLNAVPSTEHGCEWSKGYKPVEGWEAVADKSFEGSGYTVISCPKFRRDSFNFGSCRMDK